MTNFSGAPWHHRGGKKLTGFRPGANSAHRNHGTASFFTQHLCHVMTFGKYLMFRAASRLEPFVDDYGQSAQDSDDSVYQPDDSIRYVSSDPEEGDRAAKDIPPAHRRCGTAEQRQAT
jgi:hypothetical protein